MMLETNKNYFSDNREILKSIPDKSINLFLEDMPYNTTQCDWEYEVDLKEYWELRLPKLADKGLFVLTASQPFTTDLINSNRKMFKYEIIWDKCVPTGFLNAKKMHMKAHENIIIFSNGAYNYNSQKITRTEKEIKRGWKNKNYSFIGKTNNKKVYGESKKNIIEGDAVFHKHPLSIIKFSKGNGWANKNNIHPTQKPIQLFEHLIKSFTNENDLVFDGYSGSGTTAIACIRNNRNYILCENKKEYFDLQTKRILEEIDKTSLFNSLGGATR